MFSALISFAAIVLLVAHWEVALLVIVIAVVAAVALGVILWLWVEPLRVVAVLILVAIFGVAFWLSSKATPSGVYRATVWLLSLTARRRFRSSIRQRALDNEPEWTKSNEQETLERLARVIRSDVRREPPQTDEGGC